MKCQRCKEREANVQIMQQISGKKPQTFMLCDVCARELGISMPTFPMTGKVSSNPFSILGNIFQTNLGLGADEINEKPVNQCSQCNTTFDEFKRTGYLGCPHCYETFASQMDPVFSRTQMGNKHSGRKPASRSVKGLPDEKVPEDTAGIHVTDPESSGGSENEVAAPNKTPADKPSKKRKLSAREALPAKSEEESEELIALEKQHMDRLIAKRKSELAAAVAADTTGEAGVGW